MNLKLIEKDGFFVKEASSKIQNIAFISLRAALRSFFRTYQSLGHYIRFLDDKTLEKEERDRNFNIRYIEDVCTAITHFQLFVELIVKDILNRVHPLLAIDASKKHDLFFDLLNGVHLEESRLADIKQLEFSEAYNRLITLIGSEKIKEAKYKFLNDKDTKETLFTLNSLRNRIVHKGAFVLRYEAFDHLFGKYALPFLVKVSLLDEYKDIHLWHYKPISCGIDPVLAIIEAFKTEKYNKYKIAILKEFGRSAYENPLLAHRSVKGKMIYSFDAATLKKAKIMAEHTQQAEYARDLKKCPICGQITVVPFPDSVEQFDRETSEIIDSIEFIYKVKCFCCNFELDGEVHNKKTHLPIDNLFDV